MFDEDKMLKALCEFGMTKVQVRVYHTLIKLGRTSAPNMAEELNVHRSEIYRVARELVEKGVVTEHKGRPMLYTPGPPREILNILIKDQLMRIEHLKENIPELTTWLNSQAHIKREKPSILLIDDDKVTRQTLSERLRIKGFHVDEAETGRKAIEKIGEMNYNIALIDILLPDISGTELLKRLKEKNPEIIEIIITGYPSMQNAINAVNEGADAYLVKPVKPEKILQTIKEKLKKR